MAAKTKAQIVTNIDKKIITNGNIKAVDTNTILKDILDCKELNGQSSSVSTFSFASTAAIRDNRGGTLNYSLRGVKDSFVNVTFKIAVLETNVNSWAFAHNTPAIANALKSIMAPKLGFQIDFLVKIENQQLAANKPFRVGSLNFTYNTNNFNIKIDSQDGDKLFNGDQIFASFTLHCPARF
ncbi:hypothetical protein [Flavivirga eckloniae]|uniref:Uncharacterized protein n=1 Tax=Flavivirga eckloniae TaxID=1803846 RepID=A0A2K9PPR1_9FLAO|nr:hypothetical protein [Flavivirga eckloniae]AUP79063.1 hypothetical protein C1H87_10275 [Flavivirga eckloniae]